MTPSKSERLQLILTHLQDAPPVASREAALALIAQIFETIEDGAPDADRMLPPIGNMAEDYKPDIKRYRHTSHDTLIANNGSFQLRRKAYDERKRRILGEVILDKAGADGKNIRA
jgi:hypothetical protein